MYQEDLQGFVSEESVAKILSHVPLDMPCSSPSESADKTEVSNVNEYAMNIFHLSSSSNLTAKSSSFLEVLIIANTQNYEKNMIMSRRSSYQKILALEKGGVQVVERDINLPLDLILSAAVCLVWYETRNIGDGSEAFANVHSVPAFIENIATKILMSLSSSFSCCILVFEGESNFLASIMELSDMLYAAAASLDLNLQLFCSPLPESTDEIILNCIRTTNFLDRGLYPPMPESESLAESFLTRFPSLNPLSAHAILSSGGMLVDFLEWSHERRMQAVGKYKMPAESISLFNALCRFGELGESKSVMTDCSSIDSDNSGGTLQPERKRQRYGLKSRNSSMPMDESFYFQPNLLNHSRILHKNPDINSSKISNLVGNKLLGRSQQHEELINYNDNFLDEQYASISRSEFNLNKSELKSEPPIRSFLPSSRISLGHSNSFPKSLDLRSEEDWVSFDHKHGLEKETCRLKTTSSNPHLPTKKTKCDNRPADGLGLFTKEEKTPNFSDFLPSNSIQSFQRSILTTEFLSRVNDKRRMPQQPSYKKSGSSKGKAAYQKRSPSIIDSFRFQGGSQHVKEAVNRRNLPRELSKESALITPTWTPVDKRARQNLSFMRNGNEKQSRLVWRRRDSPRVDCSLSTRHRGEF
ncbi:hypothetical protein AXF42_Ash003662 [Apostasia shenzhenica]|uniref:Uncharacterized protein n=1 Tax=Apostasia shenzhenica TaxID=1088818 RepID=A0A2I0AHP0_9ASPA|nr:hypothetical protein AXF42_Ash003662 [Apostasia shenzhenica]